MKNIVKSILPLIIYFTPLLNLYADQYSDISDKISQLGYTEGVKLMAHQRLPGSPTHTRLREEIISRMKFLGYSVSEHKYGTGVNVIARKSGTKYPNEEIILSAHYDSDNSFSELICDAADDNASGVAGVLEAAKVLAEHDFERTLTLAFWDEEELHLVGSKAYVAEYHDAPIKTLMMFDFEAIGYTDNTDNTQKMPFGFSVIFPRQANMVRQNKYRANFISTSMDDSAISVTANKLLIAQAKHLDLMVIDFVLSAEKRKGGVFKDFRRSDHAAFWDYNIPAMMVSDTANLRNPSYHCMDEFADTVESLDYAFATKVVKATTYVVANLLGMSSHITKEV